MLKKTYRSFGRGGQTAYFATLTGALGTALIYHRSMAAEHRADAYTNAEARLVVALARLAEGECDSNGQPEPCDIDCNTNAWPDDLDLYMGTSRDCDANRTPDECEPYVDCNNNGTLDICDAAGNDCNDNEIPDDCELSFPTNDCQSNGILDSCDIAGGTSADANSNGTPDECEEATAVLQSAVSRHLNTAGPAGICDIPIDLVAGLPITSEPRVGRIAQVRFNYDALPGGTVTVQSDCTCPSPPVYAPTGPTVNCVPAENTLVCTFTPALPNACAYLFTAPSGAGSASVELRGLLGDVSDDGRVNGTDRSTVVSAWTGAFTCKADVNSSGTVNGTDRSVVVSAWTGVGTNCAP